jgi:putative hydrolase of the HAD superfamily
MATLITNGRYDVVTLDMGFTLVEIHSQLDQVLLELAGRAGLTRTLDEVHTAQHEAWSAWIAGDAERLWTPSLAADEATSLAIDRSICLRLGITDQALHLEASQRARAMYRQTGTYTIFPDAWEGLATLRRAVPVLGILSNWGWVLPELCADLGLAPYFDFIITSARVGASKPNARIYQHLLATVGVTPDRILHVGDSLTADVRGAQAMGITGVLIDRPGAAAPGDFPIVRSLGEVARLL